MLAPKVPKAQSKAPEGPASKLAIPHSAFAPRPITGASRGLPLFLQRTIDNEATMRLLAQPTRNTTASERQSHDKAPAPAGASLRPGNLQPKLAVGAVNDPLEHEADRVADQVMRMPDDPVTMLKAAQPQLRRKCAVCETEPEKLQSKSSSFARTDIVEAPPIVHEVLHSPGRPLDNGLQTFFESRFGRDFSGVRIHTEERAENSADMVNSLAYTVGQNVVFAKHRYDPSSLAGMQLLAHELTHVVQQGAAPIISKQSSLTRMQAVPHPYKTQKNDRIRDRPAAEQSQPNHIGIYTPRRLQRACVGGVWNVLYDGCSVPDSLAKVLRIDKNNPAGGKDTQFGLGISTSAGGRACDRHDECYQTCCPKVPGSSGPARCGKDFCDQQFLVDLLSICVKSSESAKIKGKCEEWAIAYFEGVQAGGLKAFFEDQIEACSCVHSPPK
jgi:hypothetical protein